MPEGASSLFSQSEKIEVLWVDFSVLSEVKRKRVSENVDEKIKELVFEDFTVRWLCLFGHNSAKRTSQLTAL